MATGATFKFKDDTTSEVTIQKDEIEEIIPDADFRFSLVIMKNGDKHFLCGTQQEIMEELESNV